jgi:hypothetical protein
MLPIDGLTRVVGAFGTRRDDIPSDREVAESLYRTMLADRKVLVVLDDARDAAQVRPLLPGGPGNVVLVTSRDRLTSLVVRDGAVRIDIDGLEEEHAIELLATMLGRERVAAEPDAASALSRQCRYHPLVLRLAAIVLESRRQQSIADYTAEIERTGLREMVGEFDGLPDLRSLLESL